MITFVDKETPIQNGEHKLYFSELIKMTLERSPVKGMDTGQMRKHMKLIDILEKGHKGTINIDQDLWNDLKIAFKSFLWANTHSAIIELEDYIDSLK